MYSLSPLISLALSIILALMAMAFYTLMERKFLGYFQTRKGPNKPGLMGIPVPFADAIKLFIKEQSYPSSSNSLPFVLAPLLSLTLAIFLWPLYPHTNPAFFLKFGILYFLCVSSMSVYATFAAGWASNSKYALLGALRGVAQTVSYEVSMSLILLSSLVVMMTLNMSLMTITQLSWVAMLMAPVAILWFITNLAETNRTPFDFAEGESELVSGFNIEYGSGPFALIFMAEYMNILVMSLFTAILFSSSNPTILPNMFILMKTMLLATLFVWVRATMPRMRYDHLMFLTWKCFLPFAILALMVTYPLLYSMT